MNRTYKLFEERKSEIVFYYSILVDISNPGGTIRTVDNHRFLKILKSNFLLMLYNLIESSIRSGLEEIYNAVKDSGKPYAQITEELRDIWSSHEILKANRDTANRQTYARRVKEIITHVVSQNPLELTRDALDISGNLDARQIRTILDKHNIAFSESIQGDKVRIYTVKQKRNALAHGDEAFSDASSDLSVDDLNGYKDEVFTFIGDVLRGMAAYYNERRYISS